MEDLYIARSELVHVGDDSALVDMRLAREAYVRCFVEIASRIPTLSRQSPTPLGDLTGDT